MDRPARTFWFDIGRELPSGHVVVRGEDNVVGEEAGGRMLNEHPTTMVVNG